MPEGTGIICGEIKHYLVVGGAVEISRQLLGESCGGSAQVDTLAVWRDLDGAETDRRAHAGLCGVVDEYPVGSVLLLAFPVVTRAAFSETKSHRFTKILTNVCAMKLDKYVCIIYLYYHTYVYYVGGLLHMRVSYICIAPYVY